MSLIDACTLSHRLSSFLLTHRSTPHASTNATPSELFLKRSLGACLNLLHPNIKSTVHLSQAKQKVQHDLHAKEREFIIGQHALGFAKELSSYKVKLLRN